MMGKFGRYLGERVAKGNHDGIRDMIATNIENGAVKGMGKALISRGERNFGNAYTGLSPTPLATGLFAAGAAGYSAWKYGNIQADQRVNQDVSYGGQAPIMNGDGIAPARGNAPRMGASGDLVFGLNSMRRK